MLASLRLAALSSGVALALVSIPAGAAGPDSFADIAEEAMPAVVTILTEGSAPQSVPDLPNQEFFERFFGERGSPFQGPQGAPSRQGLGSGFVIDEDGIIVTNNHVIKGAEDITVVLSDGQRLEAKLVGGDAKTDLAVLSVAVSEDLPTIEFGDTDDLRVGDWVLAVGNPFGVGASVTAGIVSARGRDIRSGPYDDFIQVDAPINRGNSGGPLLDNEGNVVGVNTAIFSPSGGNVGIGFAIPAELAERVIDDLRDDGQVDRGWIGVRIQAVTPDIAGSLSLTEARGALIADVDPASPAEAADLQAGDVILSFDGQSIDDLGDLTRAVADRASGESVIVMVWRGGKEFSVDLTVGQLQEAASNGTAPSGAPESMAGLGLDLQERDGQVIISSITPNGAADQRGIQAGDVLLRLGDRAIATLDDAFEALDEARAGGKKALLALVERDGASRFVPFDITVS